MALRAIFTLQSALCKVQNNSSPGLNTRWDNLKPNSVENLASLANTPSFGVNISIFIEESRNGFG